MVRAGCCCGRCRSKVAPKSHSQSKLHFSCRLAFGSSCWLKSTACRLHSIYLTHHSKTTKVRGPVLSCLDRAGHTWTECEGHCCIVACMLGQSSLLATLLLNCDVLHQEAVQHEPAAGWAAGHVVDKACAVTLNLIDIVLDCCLGCAGKHIRRRKRVSSGELHVVPPRASLSAESA